MKKLILLLLAAAIGTLAYSAWRGEPDGLFARLRGWVQPHVERLARRGGPKQAVVGGIDLARSTFVCNYSDAARDRVVNTYEPDRLGLGAVADVMSESGLEANFKVLAGDVPNASAFLADGERVIVYSNAWMQKVTESAQSKWGIYAVLAHEIGHHLNGDTMPKAGDYRQRTAAQNHQQELAADYFAGFVLARLGASLDETTSAVRFYGGRETHSHPDGRRRIEAQTNGWTKGRDGLADRGTETKPSQEMLDLRHAIGRHAEHYGPGHVEVNGRPVPCLAHYRLLFEGRVMKVKGLLYDAATRDVSIVDWRLDPADGRPHGVSLVETGLLDDATCYRVEVDNAGDLVYSVAPSEVGDRDPRAFVKLLQRYIALGAR
jgi:hypothetical protein